MTLYVRRMSRRDIPAAVRLDREAFPTEWPPTNFSRELENKMAFYIAAGDSFEDDIPPVAPVPAKTSLYRRLQRFFSRGSGTDSDLETATPANLLGYAGMWILADEAHITSIATFREHWQKGIGQALLIGLIETAIARNARVVTLEARVSNTRAQSLYAKFGFHKVGIRKGYYLDNREDAVIMTTDYLGEAAFRENLERLKKALIAKRGEIRYDIQPVV